MSVSHTLIAWRWKGLNMNIVCQTSMSNIKLQYYLAGVSIIYKKSIVQNQMINYNFNNRVRYIKAQI